MFGSVDQKYRSHLFFLTSTLILSYLIVKYTKVPAALNYYIELFVSKFASRPKTSAICLFSIIRSSDGSFDYGNACKFAGKVSQLKADM